MMIEHHIFIRSPYIVFTFLCKYVHCFPRSAQISRARLEPNSFPTLLLIDLQTRGNAFRVIYVRGAPGEKESK